MAEKTFRVLIVGVGSIGERHLRCFQATGRAEVSLCETDGEKRQMVQERYEVASAYGDLDTALGHQHDAAVIATPAPLHIPMAKAVISAGWHALIEKPLSTSLDGLDELVELIHERGATVAVGYVWRNHPAIVAMRDALLSGRFGKPLHLSVVSGQHFPTYRPAYREIYYARRESGGGAIQDALTHLLNLGEWLVGPIDRLAAAAAHQRLEGVDVEDTVNVITKQGNVLGSYSLNQHQAPSEMTLTVVCERGTVRCESHCQRWRWMVEPEPDGKWQDEPNEAFHRDLLYIAQAGSFLDAIEGRTRPPCSLSEAVQTLKVNLAALRAAEEETWQVVGG